jgi:predicted nucleotidyltransferase
LIRWDLLNGSNQAFERAKRASYQVYQKNLRGIYLYGSYVRQEEDPESDIDVAVQICNYSALTSGPSPLVGEGPEVRAE